MLVRNTQDVEQLSATIDTGEWSSQRLLLARDGVDYSLHDTLMKAGGTTLLDYPHHLETAYCIEGKG